MSFLESLFHKKEKKKPVVLIDISAGSIAGAYALFAPDEQPVLLYTRRLPVEVRSGEPIEDAMLRALNVLGNALIREGAPILLRATGSGRAETILVSVDAPWQETKVRTEHFEHPEPFTFTESMVATAIGKTNTAPAGQLLVDESIIGTILNGYETRDPYGKEANRATIMVLTSLIDEHVATSIQSVIRSLFHTGDILTIAGCSLRFQSMRIAFPHQSDALIIDATGEAMTTLALIRNGLLVSIADARDQTKDALVWVRNVMETLKGIMEHFPLPRTIFLLAREEEIELLRDTLDIADLEKFWVSDASPKVVSVLGSHLSGLVRQTTTAPPDLSLLLMVLYFQHRSLPKRSRVDNAREPVS